MSPQKSKGSRIIPRKNKKKKKRRKRTLRKSDREIGCLKKNGREARRTSAEEKSGCFRGK